MKRGLVFALFVCVTVVLAKRNTIDIAHVQVSDGEDIVDTPLGAVQGLVFPVSRGFFSIPYGANTGGSNRWLPPKDPPAWGNTLNATTFGPACPQNCDFPPFTCPQAGFSEDCLKVDVYTPRLSVIQSKGLRPVMVFFPGGGFTAGGSSTMLYTGNYLANNTEVVVVVVNYRLGALGFFKNNEFQGNLGIIDQTFALKWVNQYIKPFGGDPTQVTIFGESAGGMSIACQLVSPPAKPYFRAAIMESNPIQLGLNTKREIETLSKNFASLVNCSVNDQACLNSLDTDTILDAQTKAAFKISLSHPLSAFMAWEPWVDGKIISGQPIESFQKGTYNQVPVILGNVNDEGWMFIYSAFTKPMPKVEYEALLDVIFRDQAKNVLNMYPVPSNETADARPVLAVLGTDYLFACPLRNVSRHMATYKPLYLYHFDHVFSFDPWGPDYAFCIDKCCHGSELPFVFNSAPKAGYQWDAQEAVLAQFMSTNWGNFAISGNPNSPFPTNFQWPVYTLSNQVDFHYVTPQPVLEYNYRSSYCDFFDSIGYGFGVAA